MELKGFSLKRDEATVGLFNESFPPVMDGVSVCVENYAYWLQKMVGNVNVITPKVPGTDYDKLPYEVLSFFSFPVPKRPPYVTGIAEIDPVFLANLFKKRFKIVHSHSPFGSGSVGQKVARMQGIPMVATFHSKFRDDFSRVFTKPIVDIIIKYIIDFFESADLVWVPQESVIDVIREYGFKGHVEVMDNGSDLVADYPEKYFVDARNALGIKPEEFVMLFVGQHIWEKNPRLIIDALARMNDVPFKMFFVGQGYAEQAMKDLVTEKAWSRRYASPAISATESS
jgi:glycosyltransferase involved in cell wall biosynthesis